MRRVSGRVGTSDLAGGTGVEREAELARMLGGTDGATARAHARDLLGDRGRRSARPRAPLAPARRLSLTLGPAPIPSLDAVLPHLGRR